MALTAGQPVSASDMSTAADTAADDALVNAPGYLVATSIETTNSATFTGSNTQIATVTASLISGRQYWVRANAKLTSSQSLDTYQATLHEDSTAGTVLDAGRSASATFDQAVPNIIPLEALYTAVSTGSKTFVVSGVRANGTGNVRRTASTTYPLRLSVVVAV